LVPKIFEFLFGIIYNGCGSESGIDGNDGRSEALIQQQIVSLSNLIVVGDVAGGSATIVE
jgi:hypothetical protein